MRPILRLSGRLLPVLAVLLAAVPALSPAADAPSSTPPRAVEYVDGVPDTGQFLPDTAILASVNDRKISVFQFRDFYFLSDPQIRPGTDSAGRAEFLTNMIRKEVLGLTALSLDPPLDFADRATLRSFRRTLLSNRLFETNVLNAQAPPEDSVRRVFGYYQRDLKLRIVHFNDHEDAIKARRELLSGRATWEQLSDRYNPPGLRPNAGELGWSSFEKVPTGLALEIWKTKPGQVTPPLLGATGWQIFQVVESRKREIPEYHIFRPVVESLLRNNTAELNRRAIMEEAKSGMGIRYDSTNVVWASSRFSQAVSFGHDGAGQTINIDERVPEFEPADTARVLLTWKGGRLTVGDLVHAYSDLAPVMRPALNTPELLRDYVDALVTSPRMIELAEKRGLEKDPVFVRRYERKREEILVGKMVDDSVFSRISVTKDERLAWYQKHRAGFITFPSVRYALVIRDSKAAADSIRDRLEKGADLAAILRADSLAGNTFSGIQTTRSNESVAYQKVLFEEMRPGQIRVLGPDANRHFACVKLLEFDPGRQKSYDEVEGIVDESVRNEKAEAALNAFIARLEPRYRIMARYDQLMNVRLTVPKQAEYDQYAEK